MNSYSPVYQHLQVRREPDAGDFDLLEYTGPVGTYLPYLTDEPECDPFGLHPYTQSFASLSDPIVVSPSCRQHPPLSPPGLPSPPHHSPPHQPATSVLQTVESPLLNSRYSPVHQQPSPFRQDQPHGQQQAHFQAAAPRQIWNGRPDPEHLYAWLGQPYVQAPIPVQRLVPLQHSPPRQAPGWPNSNVQGQLPPTATCPTAPKQMPRTINLFSNESVMSRLPTWKELEEMSAQIRELYALRSLLHPQEHEARKSVVKHVPRRGCAPRMRGTITSQDSQDSVVIVNSPLYEDHYVRGKDGVYYCPRRAPKPAQPVQSIQASRPSQPSQRTQTMLPTVLNEETGAPGPSTRSNPAGMPQPKRTFLEPHDAATSVATIKAILQELNSRSMAFAYPKFLDFGEPELPGSQPQLKDSPNNAPLIEHREKLLGLVGRLEDVLIYGDEGVRLARLAAIDRVTSELSKVGELKTKLRKKHVRKQSRVKSRKALWKWLTTYEWK
ncbi:hypothetical protein BDV93DRAFT_544670 [Ceratobasidium sp. AG-I]|nr:hypothetical protein BDV93DRAFT_544670 [Ceratobasidium sp. AG-I]